MMGKTVDRLGIEVMGWEKLTIGYVGCTDEPNPETPRQRELLNWIEAAGIQNVGDYWIRLDPEWWMECQGWDPTDDANAAVDVMNAAMVEWGWHFKVFSPTWAGRQWLVGVGIPEDRRTPQVLNYQPFVFGETFAGTVSTAIIGALDYVKEGIDESA
jgi:hypothetical protein